MTETAGHSVLARFGRAAAVYGVAGLLSRLIAFILLPLYTRFLSPEEYGIVALADTVGILIATIGAAGLPALLTKAYFDRPEGTPEHIALVGTIFKLSALSFAFVSAALLGLGPVVIDFWARDFSAPFFPHIALALVAAVASIVIQMPLTILRAQERTKSFAIISVGHMALTAALVVLLVAVTRSGAVGLLFAKAAAAAAVAIVAVMWVRARWAGWDRVYARKAVTEALPLTPTQLVALVLASGDRLVLERYRSAAEVGIYSIGYTIGMVMSAVTITVIFAWQPLFYRLARDESRDQIARNGMRIMWGLTLIATIGVAASEHVIPIIVGHDYVAASKVVPVVIFGYLFHGIGAMFQLSVLKSGRTRAAAGVVMLAAVLNIGLNVLLVPRFGLMTCAWTTVLAFLIQMLGYGWLGQRTYPIPYSVGRLGVWVVMHAVAVAATQTPSYVGGRYFGVIVASAVLGALLLVRPK